MQGRGGRISVRPSDDEPLVESGRDGSLAGLEDVVLSAERVALSNGGTGEAHTAAVSVAAVTLGPLDPSKRAYGVIAVARRGRPFTDDDLEVLRSLGAEAALALENIEFHFQMRRQAVRTSGRALRITAAFRSYSPPRSSRFAASTTRSA